jgi:hypothetical protein
MSSYRERRLARADRLDGWSESNAARSDARYAGAKQISDGIPFGQPILVGHHSEARHRRDAARIHDGMRAAIDLDSKARRQSSAAAEIRAQAAGAIYDDDPDAIDALRAKVAKLESKREDMKRANAEYRKAHKAELAAMSAYERSQAIPFPSYSLQNIGGNIKRCRDRLARLEREKAAGGPPDRMIYARFASDCADCGAPIAKGDRIRYSRAAGARCAEVCAS